MALHATNSEFQPSRATCQMLLNARDMSSPELLFDNWRLRPLFGEKQQGIQSGETRTESKVMVRDQEIWRKKKGKRAMIDSSNVLCL